MQEAASLHELVCAARAGEAGAFEELARRYRPGVYALCLDRARDFDIAADLTQEALLKAHAALGKLREAEAFGAWLRRIALNCCASWVRRPSLSLVDLEAAEHLPGPSTLAEVSRRQLARELAAALAELPERNRLAFLMHVQGSSYREIADFTGAPETTLVGRIHRARSGLRALLRERLGEAITNEMAAGKGRGR